MWTSKVKNVPTRLVGTSVKYQEGLGASWEYVHLLHHDVDLFKVNYLKFVEDGKLGAHAVTIINFSSSFLEKELNLRFSVILLRSD